MEGTIICKVGIDPMEVMAEVLSSLKVKFDEAVKSNDYVTIMKYSEAMTAVAKGITEMQSGRAPSP